MEDGNKNWRKIERGKHGLDETTPHWDKISPLEISDRYIDETHEEKELQRTLFSNDIQKLEENEPSISSIVTKLEILDRNFMTDNFPVFFNNVELFESPQILKLLKFLVLTITSVVTTHTIVRKAGWDYDANFSISDFFTYDFPCVCLDTISYFFVGRLHKRKGIDRMFTFILPLFLGNILPSWEGEWKFLQNSVSLYAIVCTWPWKLYLFTICITVLVSILIFRHIRQAFHDQIFVSRIVEFGICVSIFLLPYISNPNFHFHHWYASWLFGMHSNMGTWWSEIILAFSWGTYINGIAVYGRDPILSCAYSYYLSTDNRCYYMECYHEDDDDGGGGGYKPFIPPDWRNCNAAGL